MLCLYRSACPGRAWDHRPCRVRGTRRVEGAGPKKKNKLAPEPLPVLLVGTPGVGCGRCTRRKPRSERRERYSQGRGIGRQTRESKR